MDNQKLIEYVREYEFLYDTYDKRYRDNQKKDEAWNEISREMNVPEKECKKAWTLLRDSFRRAIKKQKESGQVSVPSRKWKYEDEMAFLLPYLKEKSITCSMKTKNEDYDSSDDNFGGTEFLYDHDSTNFVNHPSHDYNQMNTSTIATSTINTPSKSQQKTTFKAKKLTNEESPSTVLMKYILENNKKADDIEQFFAGIATTVQSFPLRDKAVAKARVFEVISKMEMDILNRSYNNSTDQCSMSPYSNDSQARSPYNSFSQSQPPEPFNEHFVISPSTKTEPPDTFSD